MRIPGNVYSNAQIAAHNADRSAAAQTKEADADKKAAGLRGKEAENVTVSLSSHAKELASSNALDTAKVDRLRAAINGGTFAVDHGAIAAKLIETGG